MRLSHAPVVVKPTAASRARLSLLQAEAGEGAGAGDRGVGGGVKIKPLSRGEALGAQGDREGKRGAGVGGTKRASFAAGGNPANAAATATGPATASPLPQRTASLGGTNIVRHPRVSTSASTSTPPQTARGKEVFLRERRELEGRERARREKEERARRAREEAAERGRVASREWAERERLRGRGKGGKGEVGGMVGMEGGKMGGVEGRVEGNGGKKAEGKMGGEGKGEVGGEVEVEKVDADGTNVGV